MLDDAAALQKARLVPAVEHTCIHTSGHDIRKVGLKLAHLSRTVEHIYPPVVVEQQRGVMEMRYARHQRPFTRRILRLVDISAERGVVG